MDRCICSKCKKDLLQAFNNKALAFEVHDLFNSSVPASSIINSLWNDNTLTGRVGAAMWWISGNTTYQPGLITVLENFPVIFTARLLTAQTTLPAFRR